MIHFLFETIWLGSYHFSNSKEREEILASFLSIPRCLLSPSFLLIRPDSLKQSCHLSKDQSCSSVNDVGDFGLDHRSAP